MLVDPNAPLDEQVSRQAKIIDALMRRAGRETKLGTSAFRAFQSAIDLQQQVQAQRRDLARAENELQSERLERDRQRKNLVEALSSMEEGFALFTKSRLDLCNDLFRTLLPDIAGELHTGMGISAFLERMASSAHFRNADRQLVTLPRILERQRENRETVSVVIELDLDRWFQLSAQHTSNDNIVLLLTDITTIVRRNRDEQETLIDRQEDYLQAVFHHMSSGVCTFSETGEVMMHNARFREILNLPFHLLEPGTQVNELLDYLSTRGLLQPGVEKAVERGRRELLTQGWLRLRIRHGHDRVLDIQANAMPDRGFLVEMKDVTLEARTTEMLENRVMERTAELTRANDRLVQEYEEKARVEEALRRAKERAEAAVSSKTRFLAAASHDLLQPINAAKLLIATLMTSTRDTDLFALVERLDGSFRSTEQLLHSLLDISRLESADPDTVQPISVNLAGIMSGIHADQTLLAFKRNVRLDIVPSSAVVHSDPVYLWRSIQNLVVNAIQYTEPGGRVLVGCRKRGGRVVLEVWDTGIGISIRDQDRIFDEFARAENVPFGSGMGLGLSVVDRACRLLGHGLSVRSKPGVGSVFSIEMETVDDPAAISEPAVMLPVSTDALEDRIVMAIENDADVLFGMTRWLEQTGASVLPMTSTEESLRTVEDMGMPPDIILADYQLDGDDTGVEAIARIREMTRTHVPAIIITANRSDSLREAGVQNDVAVLKKPVKLSQLRTLMAWQLRQAQDNRPAENETGGHPE